MGILEATVTEPLFQLINHIYVTDRGPSAPARGLRDSGELRLLPKGAVLSLTLLLVRCLR